MDTEQAALSSSLMPGVENGLQQHETQLRDVNFVTRKAEEASSRRYEAAGWLRKTVGVVLAKDLPAEPSEEEFRLGLRSGIILCNVLNKVQPGSVQRVVEGPCDSVIIPDGAALSAYQYFENVRNFLVAVEKLGLPPFEFSDLEQGGKSARVVDCVLAMKSYDEWTQGGKIGQWKYGGHSKPPTPGKPFSRRNSESIMNAISRTCSQSEKSIDAFSDLSSYSDDLSESGLANSLGTLVRELLSDKKQEEVPMVVETVLSKVMEDFERRLERQNEQILHSKGTVKESRDCSAPKKNAEDVEVTINTNRFPIMDEASTQIEEEEHDQKYIDDNKGSDKQRKMEVESLKRSGTEELNGKEYICDESSDSCLLKQRMLIERQESDIQELKDILHRTTTGMQDLQMKYKEDMNNLGQHLYILTHAASRYKKVLEENRKLYNQIQDLKGNIRVYCRVRPFLPGQSSHFSTVSHVEEGNITILTPSKYGKEGKKTFTFNRAYGPCSTQEEVFTDTQPLVRSVLDGYNVCIFAYGQTGSGKTFTMTGPPDLNEETLGVNYRALRDLFLLSEQRKDTICYEISVQMLEIYNEQVRDLLVTDGSNKRLEIRNSSQSGINVPDASLVPVSSTADVIYLMDLGHRNRTVSATAMNDRSSRSHSCVTVHVQGKDLTSGTILRSSMHLVDLAGSERVDKSEVTGDRLKEAQHINKSLSALGDVISSLASNNAHVPYRNSKLTQLLQDSLGGQAKTLMFVCMSPEPDALVETLSTLKFAERVSTVELGAARVNKESTDMKELKEQVNSLKGSSSKREGEPEQLQTPMWSSPERSSSLRSSPSHSSRKSTGGDSPRHTLEDMDSIEVRRKSKGKLKRRSLDPQDIRSSLRCPSSASVGLTRDTKDSNDKVLFKKESSILEDDDSLLISSEADNRQLPAMSGQSRLPDPSKIKNDQVQELSHDSNSSRPDTPSTDDSDELEVATSDSSEQGMLWQSNIIPKTTVTTVTINPNESASKGKKSQLRLAKSIETRSMIPSLIPSPQTQTRKPVNSANQTSQRPGRQAGNTNNGKRRSGVGK